MSNEAEHRARLAAALEQASDVGGKIAEIAHRAGEGELVPLEEMAEAFTEAGWTMIEAGDRMLGHASFELDCQGYDCGATFDPRDEWALLYRAGGGYVRVRLCRCCARDYGGGDPDCVLPR